MRLGHFDLNLLVTLDALLETCSITRASERLHIGASATSSALGRLREHFQDELLVQVGRRMTPTPLALQLRGPVRELILRTQATLSARTTFDPTVAQRRFVINATDYATIVLLAPLAQRLESLAPGLSIDIVALGDSNLQQLERGETDLAIYPSRNASPDHPTAHLLSEDHTCLVWTGHHLTGERMGFDDYMAASHVAARFGEQRIATFEHWFLQEHQVERRIDVSASSFNALPFLIVGSQRVATLQRRLARMYVRLLPLRMIEPPFPIPPLELVMQWNRHQDLDPGLAWLRAQLMDVARVA
ncbi:MAG: hypothetical protein RLY78_2839 [Pseudomonadota bacterium]|uniref:LysR family transcriptional regulator n=1 Tax=Pseudaquabacterium rugosum TaxID=2984194 RepID=A0ABU9BGH3_9BURK